MTSIYKLIAIDIDGTLVDKSHVISDVNLKALRKARDQGVKITLSTGRMFPAARSFALLLNLDVPIITNQGSQIRYAHDDKIIYKQVVDSELAYRVVSYLEKKPGRTFLYVDDLLIASGEDEYTTRYLQHSPDVKLTIIEQMAEWLGQGDKEDSLLKISYVATPEMVSEELKSLQKLFELELELTRTYPGFLEMGPKGIHKGSALRWLADYYGISMSETMVIGDSVNDIEMFEEAGLAIVVADGQEKAIAAADEITAACAEDGVAVALKRHVIF